MQVSVGRYIQVKYSYFRADIKQDIFVVQWFWK